MTRAQIQNKIDRFEKQKAYELSNGWTKSAEHTSKVIKSLKINKYNNDRTSN